MNTRNEKTLGSTNKKESAESIEAKKHIEAYLGNILEATERDVEFTRLESVEAKLQSLNLQNEFTEDEYAILERKLRSKDSTTGADIRDKQNDTIRREFLRLKEKEGGIKENANKVGIISFDVRGLKVVNDATKDHHVGDAFLRSIADTAKTKIIPKMEQLLGAIAEKQGIAQKPKVTLGRDGGDEFSLFISSDIDLDSTLSTEEVQNFGLDSEKRLEGYSNRLMDVLTEYTDITFAETKLENILPKEVLKKHFPDTIIPDEWTFRAFVASGGSTLSEILNDPRAEHFKNINGGKIKNGMEPINILLGAMRTEADEKSYIQKEKQNKKWRESEHPVDKFQARMQVRNKEMNDLMNERDRLNSEINNLNERINNLKAEVVEKQTELDTCRTEVADLKVGAA